MIDLFVLVLALLGMVLVRLLLQRQMRINAPPRHCRWPEDILNHTDTLAWIAGGPKRVMETWFAQLSLGKVLTQEKGVFRKGVLDHSVDTQSWSSFTREAFALTPSQGAMLSLNKVWRPALEKFKEHLIDEGVVLLPDPRRLLLSQVLMGVLMLVSTLVLFFVFAHPVFLVPWVMFLVLGIKWWMFRSMPTFVSPVAKQHAFVLRQEHQASILSPLASSVALATALEGSRVLLNTPFDAHSFPQMHASRLDASSQVGTGCSTSIGWSGCSGSSSTGDGDGSGCGGGCGGD